MEAILRAPHAVAGGPWPGDEHALEVRSVECWHIKVDVGEADHDGIESSWLRAQHPTVIVRLTTADGAVGWGEAMGIGGCGEAVKTTIETLITPQLLAPAASARTSRNSLAAQAEEQNAATGAGRAANVVTDIEATMRRLQQAVHLQGRYGITMFALSGIEIALWDLAAKAHGVPLCELLRDPTGERARPTPHTTLPVYASLMRYGEPDSVAAVCRAVEGAGFGAVKLHEITEQNVAAARGALSDGMQMMVDVNCPWTPEESEESSSWMTKYDVLWLEEPVFPPEDFLTLSRLQSMAAEGRGVDIAAGENACTAHEFFKMFEAGAVKYAQPSVIKCGGIVRATPPNAFRVLVLTAKACLQSEICRIGQMAAASGVRSVPWSFCPGPGFLATLHLAAVSLNDDILVERIFAEYQDTLFPDMPPVSDGTIAVPSGVGLGYEVDMAAVGRCELPPPSSKL